MIDAKEWIKLNERWLPTGMGMGDAFIKLFMLIQQDAKRDAIEKCMGLRCGFCRNGYKSHHIKRFDGMEWRHGTGGIGSPVCGAQDMQDLLASMG